jgi:hypothetical protein
MRAETEARLAPGTRRNSELSGLSAGLLGGSPDERRRTDGTARRLERALSSPCKPDAAGHGRPWSAPRAALERTRNKGAARMRSCRKKPDLLDEISAARLIDALGHCPQAVIEASTKVKVMGPRSRGLSERFRRAGDEKAPEKEVRDKGGEFKENAQDTTKRNIGRERTRTPKPPGWKPD